MQSPTLTAEAPAATVLSLEDYTGLNDDELSLRVGTAKVLLGTRLLILGHHYQRDEIIKYADLRGDSFKLARQAAESDSTYIVFCGVHFMAESADILTSPEQIVILPDMAAGCSMADMADIDQVEDAWSDLVEVLGPDHVTPVTYMNSAANLKAFCGDEGGIVCTSTNAEAVLRWGFSRREKILFFPDQHLGRNTAKRMGIPLGEMIVWDPYQEFGGNVPEAIRSAKIILWKGHCSVHQIFRPQHVDYFRKEYPNINIIAHPECQMEVVDLADYTGSTEKIIRTVTDAPAGTRWAVGTELHLVERLKQELPEKEVFFLSPTVCVCSTMYRIDLAHLCWCLENLLEDRVVNQVKVSGDIAASARIALERMLAVT